MENLGFGGAFFVGTPHGSSSGARPNVRAREDLGGTSRSEGEPALEEPPSVCLDLKDLDSHLAPGTVRRADPQCVGFVDQAGLKDGNTVLMTAYECRAPKVSALDAIVPRRPNHEFVLTWRGGRAWQRLRVEYFVDACTGELDEEPGAELFVVAGYGGSSFAVSPQARRRHSAELHHIVYGMALDLAHLKGLNGKLYELCGGGCELVSSLSEGRRERFKKETPRF